MEFAALLFSLSAILCFGFVRGSDKWDPEETMTAGELITSKGYPCEEHYVITQDGFILNLQRIPHGIHQRPGGPAILLQHGLLASSTNFLVNLANESLAFILADAGMDVWMGNSRGNTYSRNHTSLKPSQKLFWQWSWDEMAAYDLPAVLDYVLDVSGFKQLYYVGHSQGTTLAFAGLSEKPELQNKIKLFFAMAPVATVEHVTSPIRLLAPYIHELEELLGLLGDYELLPKSPFITKLANNTCKRDPVICENILFLLTGFDFKHTNKSRMPVYVAQSFAGTSVFDLLHFAQEIKSGKFQKYDYGSPSNNHDHYNQSTPPEYHPENVKLPVAIYRGDRDWLADPTDVTWLMKKLPNIIVDREIADWNHMDFILGMNAAQLCYTDIIKLIRAHPL